jgi:hypothetical protein
MEKENTHSENLQVTVDAIQSITSTNLAYFVAINYAAIWDIDNNLHEK